jgi:two-component system cell cycle response regulator
VSAIRLTDVPRAPRQRTLYAGVLIHGAAGLTTDCAVRDISDGGARIKLTAMVVLSAPVVLLIPRIGDAHEIQAIWQRGPELGLRFLRKIDLKAPESDIDRLTRRLWLERMAR